MTTLRSLLSTDYLSKLNEIEKIMYNIAGKTKIFFPTFTNHGTDHLKNVESYVDFMIPDEIKEKMSKEEIFFLLCGVWLHDVGMVPKDEEELKIFKSLEKPKDRDKFTKEVRDIHHARSYNYINQNFEELGINKLEAKIIGQIAKGHRETNLSNLADINYNGIQIRISSLASVLRLADECDVSKDRESPLSDIDVDEETRKKYYKKLKLVNHVWFDHKKGIIYVSCMSENEEDIDLVNEVVNEIKKKLKQTKQHLINFGIKFHDVKLDNQSDKIYEKIIISKIADENFDFDKLTKEIPKTKIEEILENLTAEGLFDKDDHTNGFEKEFDAYKKLFNKFKGPSNLKMFFFTKYSQDMVDICFKDLTNKFEASFGKGRKNRVAILKNSPTAFNFALTFDELIGDENFKINSPDDGSTIVDHILLMSLFNDITYYKDLINFNEVEEYIGDLIKNKSTILEEIKKYKNNTKINKGNNNQPYKINSFGTSNYPSKIERKIMKKYPKLNKREINLTCENLFNLSSRMIQQLTSSQKLNLIVYDKYYEQIPLIKQSIYENVISSTYSSEQLPFTLTIKYEKNKSKYNPLSCSVYPKSDKINDLLNWSKFNERCSEQTIIFKLQNKIEFECKIPKIDIDQRLIEFYEAVNKLNKELDLEITHEKNYIIAPDEYEYTELINSFLENKQIEVPSINVKTNIEVSELKTILQDDTIPIEIGYDHFPIKILGNNIDLGKYNVKLLAGEIINKDELLKKTNELQDIVQVTLIIENHDSDKILLKFS